MSLPSLASSSSSSSVRPAFVAHVKAYLQTAVPLAPSHVHPAFVFRGSIPAGVMQSSAEYLRYRDGVLASFPDWLNRATEVVFSRAGGKESAIAKVSWSGTNTGDGGVLGGDHAATGRRVSYRGLVWLEQDADACAQAGVDGLTGGEVYGDLARFKRQLAGEETVLDDEWQAVREPVDLGV